MDASYCGVFPDKFFMVVAKYRPAINIVLKLLECISKGQSKGRALKTHIMDDKALIDAVYDLAERV